MHGMRLSALLVFFACFLTTGRANPPDVPPWETARPLRELARAAFIESRLNPSNPQPDTAAYPLGPAMVVSSLKQRTTLWGPPDRMTVSLNKNDVWDRRYNPVPAPTLAEIRAGAFSPAHANFVNPQEKVITRPHSLGYLREEGGSFDPHRQPFEYPFPSLKPAGQIILGLDDFKGAAAPLLRQNCADGVVGTALENNGARADVRWVLGMTSNLYAIRSSVQDLTSPPTLHLYRHRDTAHRVYMSADGLTYTRPGSEAGKVWNGPIDPPEAGQDGRFFWIRQKLPAEKTFPNGFETVVMAVSLTGPAPVLSTLEGKTGLGTPPPDPWIREATGAAATAVWKDLRTGTCEVLVTVVTTRDHPDPLGEARRRLESAAAAGFDGVVRENEAWFRAFYDLRENGRVFAGDGNPLSITEVRDIYRSWYCNHGGGTKTDMRRYEASAHYAAPETDRQPWNSLPCYNEIFYTADYVHNRGDRVDMWKQLLEHWAPGARENARSMFGMPGMYLPHGYQPPVKPDEYVHNAIALELCLATMAGLVRPLWDEWDYGGDPEFLRDTVYPFLKEVCEFYAAYVTKEDDGLYHIIPSMQEESWGIYPRFSRNKDVVSSLCMFRWAFRRAAEAAELLNVDADLRTRWIEIANHLPPNPTWDKPGGRILAGMAGVEPFRGNGEHPWDAALYPAILADEIHLDSPAEDRDMVARTALLWPNHASVEALVLAGRLSPANIPNTSGPPDKPADATSAWQVGANRTVETLLNSRGPRIHIFPNTPDPIEVAFRRLQARGGFLISASRRAGGVFHLEIEARRSLPCRIANPWPGRTLTITEHPGELPVSHREEPGSPSTIVFPAVKGKRYTMQAVAQ